MYSSAGLGAGYDTELMIIGLEGETLDRGRYVVGCWPQLPTYRGGNLLVFREHPGPESLPEWDRLFVAELGSRGLRHRHFGWSVRNHGWGDTRPFVDRGYSREHTRVFAGRQVVVPAHAHAGVLVRVVRDDRDWADLLRNQMHVVGGEATESDKRFVSSRMARYRALAEAGRGRWFGAFLGEALVGSCGAYHVGEVARFQSVVTDPAARGQGVATALVARAAAHLLTRGGARRVVICAQADSSAERIYRSLGLARVDEMGSLIAPPPP